MTFDSTFFKKKLSSRHLNRWWFSTVTLFKKFSHLLATWTSDDFDSNLFQKNFIFSPSEQDSDYFDLTFFSSIFLVFFPPEQLQVMMLDSKFVHSSSLHLEQVMILRKKISKIFSFLTCKFFKEYYTHLNDDDFDNIFENFFSRPFLFPSLCPLALPKSRNEKKIKNVRLLSA